MRITSHSFLRFAVPVAVLLLLLASSVFIFQVRTKEYESWTTAPGTVLEVEWVRDFRVRIIILMQWPAKAIWAATFTIGRLRWLRRAPKS